jgi:3-hydroxyacyl-CoA dehydrogenase/enoyl-CoA hydratase/3-hydroxybutyryl-CoA epimerase
MADKGDKFYTTATKTAEVELEQVDNKSTDTQSEMTEHKD